MNVYGFNLYLNGQFRQMFLLVIDYYLFYDSRCTIVQFGITQKYSVYMHVSM